VIRADRAAAPPSLAMTVLLRTGTISGESAWSALIERSLFGMQLRQSVRRYASPEAAALAVQVTGTLPAPAAPATGAPEDDAGGATERHVNVIMVSDVDVISETFFNLRRQGFEDFNFDNVTFALNCIDVLSGDESFVALRKHRPVHRTLSRVEALNEVYADRQRAETEEAEARAADQLAQAQARLDANVGKLRERADLDEQTRAIMLRNLEDVENRRLGVVKTNIEQEKEQSIDRARADMQIAVAGIQRNIKWWAALLPPVPTLLLAIVLFAYRYKREKIGVSERQLVRAKS
jgi:ABC-2 type transport system permease protein